MIKTDDKTLCSGCGVCALVCPKECISYEKDVIGSLYASVNEKMCINCGACQKVCPIQQPFGKGIIGLNSYAAYSKNQDIRFRGSSGGLFETISEWVLGKKGSIFACGFDENLKLRMVEATTIEEVRKLVKSKYLQSSAAYIFPAIRERVKRGTVVLVCSTPCQIAALKKYLGDLGNADNLFLMDFFCHGVPSQELFDKGIKYVEQRKGISIISYEFRSKKRNGSTPHYYSIKYRINGTLKHKTDFYFNDPFYFGFQKNITLRDSCYHCPYGTGNHVGDITIGDFHDIDKYIKGINRFDGVSTVIINTQKGQKLWEITSDSLVTHQMDLAKLYTDCQIYSGGTKEPISRSEFLSDMEKMQFEHVVEKWFDSKKEWKKKIYYRFPRFIRDAIKSMARL
jgi:coenzyme F420-reducing hydrogenase beta subunit